MLLASGPIRKAGGGGGAVSFRPDKKSGGGGVLSASGPIQKAGKGWGGGGGGGGGRLLSRRGEGTLNESGVGGGCNPLNPSPPPSHPSLPGQIYTRQEYFASNPSAQSERVNSQLCRLRITHMFNAAGRPSDSIRPQPRWVSSYLYVKHACTFPCTCIVWITNSPSPNNIHANSTSTSRLVIGLLVYPCRNYLPNNW